MMGFLASVFSISWVNTPEVESPTTTSASFSVSASERGASPFAKAPFHSSMSSLRPL